VLACCSCPDSSMRQMKCKHIWSIEYAIRLATVKDVNKLLVEVTQKVTKQSGIRINHKYGSRTTIDRISCVVPDGL
jgi:predicted nucleic acid-binding Zn finger protein